MKRALNWLNLGFLRINRPILPMSKFFMKPKALVINKLDVFTEKNIGFGEIILSKKLGFVVRVH
jgi:hypothetical protein